MKLTVFWHKPCAPSPTALSGYAARGTIIRQIVALSECFDETRLVGPCSRAPATGVETEIDGNSVTVVPLGPLAEEPRERNRALPLWLARNGAILVGEVVRADAVFVLIPSPIAMLAMLLALALRKPLFARQMNTWFERRPIWQLERRLLESVAGGRNVILATGGGDAPPSRRNPAIRWIFNASVSEREIAEHARPRSFSPERGPHLVVVSRQIEEKGTRILLESLPAVMREFPGVTLDVVGEGPDRPRFERVAHDLRLDGRVTFHGYVTHAAKYALLERAHLFCLATVFPEAYTKAVLEALICGVPVVTTAVAVPPAIVRRGCGVVLDEVTPAAVAAAVHTCLSDPERYRRMSLEALRTARDYSLERWREAVCGILEEAWGPLRSTGSARR